MYLESLLTDSIVNILQELYGEDLPAPQLSTTKKEFDGHFTLIVFPYLKFSKKSPEKTGEEIGNRLVESLSFIDKFNVVKGFLNLTLKDEAFIKELLIINDSKNYGRKEVTDDAPLIMVEYSSPNTNKPLHLGHIRNNLLGYSLSKILEANGNNVLKTNIVNDRGIHICKSMLAWKKWGEGETPASSGVKGDHLIGKYYVLYNTKLQEEIEKLPENKRNQEYIENHLPLVLEAREMLRKWENGDKDTISLWKKMNEWVYDGFDITYKRLGVDFDKIYYESDTYLVGKKEVLRGLDEGIFTRHEDGSVWADLTNEGLDQKILLRADGTSVYMTQDIGTAKLRFEDYPIDQMIYVVGNEQNYHFQVLSIILDKLGFSFGKDLIHFSYGMVELPDGKMKSREGTVVDADDLMDEVIQIAYERSLDQQKIKKLNEDEAREVARKVGLGALKYFLLKVDPKKNLLYNKEESIDFNGNTAPFLQYTYARIRSIVRNAQDKDITLKKKFNPKKLTLSEKEKALILRLGQYPEVVRQAGEDLSPALIANYSYDLAKEYNQFYHDHSILNAEGEDLVLFRLTLSNTTANVLKDALDLLGIEVPEVM